MTYNAVIESDDGARFRATLLGWPDCTAEGRTRAEALRELRKAIEKFLAKVEIVPIEVESRSDPHPWMKFAGMFEKDPVFEQVLEDIEAYRRELDEDPSTR